MYVCVGEPSEESAVIRDCGFLHFIVPPPDELPGFQTAQCDEEKPFICSKSKLFTMPLNRGRISIFSFLLCDKNVEFS